MLSCYSHLGTVLRDPYKLLAILYEFLGIPYKTLGLPYEFRRIPKKIVLVGIPYKFLWESLKSASYLIISKGKHWKVQPNFLGINDGSSWPHHYHVSIHTFTRHLSIPFCSYEDVVAGSSRRMVGCFKSSYPFFKSF